MMPQHHEEEIQTLHHCPQSPTRNGLCQRPSTSLSPTCPAFRAAFSLCLKQASLFLPQGLCTSCSHCLECFFPKIFIYLASSLVPCLLLRDAFPTHNKETQYHFMPLSSQMPAIAYLHLPASKHRAVYSRLLPQRLSNS